MGFFTSSSLCPLLILFLYSLIFLKSVEETNKEKLNESIKSVGWHSKIGDETFIIAALMAMRQPKFIVLRGALSALFVMTVLSTGLGRIVPHLISRKHTNSAATGYFMPFLACVCFILHEDQVRMRQAKAIWRKWKRSLNLEKGRRFFAGFFLDFALVFLESFVLTFLAEWGDRNGISMIALATNKSTIGVAVDAFAIIGGLLFLGFSLSSYFYPPL